MSFSVLIKDILQLHHFISIAKLVFSKRHTSSINFTFSKSQDCPQILRHKPKWKISKVTPIL